MTKFLKVGAVALCFAMAAGCTDLKPLQAQMDDLKSQIGKVSADQASMKSSIASAQSAATAAAAAAQKAQSTADSAMAATKANADCCAATNEKIDRMFKKSMSK